MAKGKRGKALTEAEKEASAAVLRQLLDGSPEEAPKGFEDRGENILGWWPPVGAGGILCTPLSCKLHDGSIDPTKPSVLVIARLESDRKLLAKDGKEVLDCRAGDTIAFWAKPGMRPIRNLAGVQVYIRATGRTIDVGKGNPMVEFEVKSDRPGSQLPITEDRREKSKHVVSWIE